MKPSALLPALFALLATQTSACVTAAEPAVPAPRASDCAGEGAKPSTRAPMGIGPRRPMMVEPVAWWRLEEGAGARLKDLSGNGNDGELRGTSWTTDTPGGASNGHALAFDGTAIAVVPPSTTLTLASKFTLMAWIKPTDPMLGGTGGTVGVLAQGRPSGGAGYRLGIESGRANLGMNNDRFNCSLSSKTMLVAGRWTHIAATYDGTTMRVYVDGLPNGTSSCASGPLVPSHRPVYLGRDHDLPESVKFVGSIDEARVHDVVLDDVTVKSIFDDVGRR